MKNIKEITKETIKEYNYNDPLTIASVFETASKVKREKMIAEEQLKEQLIKEEGEKKKKDSDSYFFKNILFFTNDRDSETNKTLKNLEEAVKGKDVKIFPFIAEEVDYKATDDEIKWHDNKNKYKVNEQSNIDTIVITRLGAQDSEECIELIKELQDWGFFVLNPIQAATLLISTIFMLTISFPERIVW